MLITEPNRDFKTCLTPLILSSESCLAFEISKPGKWTLLGRDGAFMICTECWDFERQVLNSLNPKSFINSSFENLEPT